MLSRRMLMGMRTTVNLPDALLVEVKQRAAAQDRTFTSLLEEALRDLLAKPARRAARTAVPTDGRPDGRLLVDLLDKDALAAALDADGPR